MSSGKKKYITNFEDEYGNTRFGSFIAICTVDDSGDIPVYKIEEPVSVKNNWRYCLGGINALPKHLAEKYPVGFYTTGSHYKICKEAGYAECITGSTKAYYEKKSTEPNGDVRINTWYSDGLKLKKDISDNQTHLYHL